MPAPLWQAAASLAARAHAHQLRHDARTPYTAHPFRVAMTVRDTFGCDDPEALAIALLHDTIEDTTVDYDDILLQFGAGVADGVAALTKNKTLREDIREVEYDQRIAAADWRVRVVKLADTFDNLCDTGSPADANQNARMRRMIARCRRAIALAQPDLKANETTQRAVALVTQLVANAEAELARHEAAVR